MKKNLLGFILIILLLGGAVFAQDRLQMFNQPCERAITYSLGSFDSKFEISEADFLKEVEKAASVWEQPLNLDLFRYDPKGKLKINLIYDYRQEATVRLEALGLNIDDTQASYEALRARYTGQTSDYDRLKMSLDATVADYNTKKKNYEDQVKYWNSQGGASPSTANQLNAQRDALNAQADKINRDQATLNNLAGTINDMVDVLNRMAANLKLNVANYNNIGASRGEEFEEGVYIQSGRNKEINIYEFNSRERLVRVLAHEFGHALGLEHIDSNSNAIMYRLNQSANDEATAEDIAAIKQLCKLN